MHSKNKSTKTQQHKKLGVFGISVLLAFSNITGTPLVFADGGSPLTETKSSSLTPTKIPGASTPTAVIYNTLPPTLDTFGASSISRSSAASSNQLADMTKYAKETLAAAQKVLSKAASALKTAQTAAKTAATKAATASNAVAIAKQKADKSAADLTQAQQTADNDAAAVNGPILITLLGATNSALTAAERKAASSAAALANKKTAADKNNAAFAAAVQTAAIAMDTKNAADKKVGDATAVRDSAQGLVEKSMVLVDSFTNLTPSTAGPEKVNQLLEALNNTRKDLELPSVTILHWFITEARPDAISAQVLQNTLINGAVSASYFKFIKNGVSMGINCYLDPSTDEVYTVTQVGNAPAAPYRGLNDQTLYKTNFFITLESSDFNPNQIPTNLRS